MIWIVEGELDRLVLTQHLPSDAAAVTSTGGADTFARGWASLLKAPHIFVLYDNDEAGERGATKVRAALPRAVSVPLPLWLGRRGDLTDYFLAGGTYEALLDLARHALRRRR